MSDSNVDNKNEKIDSIFGGAKAVTDLLEGVVDYFNDGKVKGASAPGHVIDAMETAAKAGSAPEGEKGKEIAVGIMGA